MLRYSMNGDLLWFRDYTGQLPAGMAYGGDMCLSGLFGYMIASSTSSQIAQTDWLGYLVWHRAIPGSNQRCGLSLNPTMDGGYIFSGWTGYEGPRLLEEYSPPADTGLSYDGWLVKLDSLGIAEWYIGNDLGIPYSNYFNCARQLLGGGYIVAGKIGAPAGSGGPNGYLLRYAPETGIEGSSDPVTVLNLSPNPFSTSLLMRYSLHEPGDINLSIYDLSGRLIENLESGSIPSGEHSHFWNPDPSLPEGCYLVVLDACNQRIAQRCVKLD
jgi:hypothetical protein